MYREFKYKYLYTYFLSDKYTISRTMCDVGNIKHGHAHNRILPFTLMICMYLIDHHVVKFVVIHISMTVNEFNII
jgi:hypothetical protein